MSTHIPGERISDPFLSMGDVIKAGAQDYMIVGYRSSVNYLAARVSDGKQFLLKRSGSYIYVRYDQEAYFKFADAKKEATPDLRVGDMVKTIGTGKYGNRYGIVSSVGVKVHMIEPGVLDSKINGPATGFVKVDLAEFASHLTEKAFAAS